MKGRKISWDRWTLRYIHTKWAPCTSNLSHRFFVVWINRSEDADHEGRYPSYIVSQNRLPWISHGRRYFLCSRGPTGRGIRFKPGAVRVRIPPGVHGLVAERNMHCAKDAGYLWVRIPSRLLYRRVETGRRGGLKTRCGNTYGFDSRRLYLSVGSVAAIAGDCKSLTEKHRRFESFPADFRDMLKLEYGSDSESEDLRIVRVRLPLSRCDTI